MPASSRGLFLRLGCLGNPLDQGVEAEGIMMLVDLRLATPGTTNPLLVPGLALEEAAPTRTLAEALLWKQLSSSQQPDR